MNYMKHMNYNETVRQLKDIASTIQSERRNFTPEELRKVKNMLEGLESEQRKTESKKSAIAPD